MGGRRRWRNTIRYVYIYISLHMCVSVYIYDIVYVKIKFRRKRETVVEVDRRGRKYFSVQIHMYVKQKVVASCLCIG